MLDVRHKPCGQLIVDFLRVRYDPDISYALARVQQLVLFLSRHHLVDVVELYVLPRSRAAVVVIVIDPRSGNDDLRPNVTVVRVHVRLRLTVADGLVGAKVGVDDLFPRGTGG